MVVSESSLMEIITPTMGSLVSESRTSPMKLTSVGVKGRTISTSWEHDKMSIPHTAIAATAAIAVYLYCLDLAGVF